MQFGSLILLNAVLFEVCYVAHFYLLLRNNAPNVLKHKHVLKKDAYNRVYLGRVCTAEWGWEWEWECG